MAVYSKANRHRKFHLEMTPPPGYAALPNSYFLSAYLLKFSINGPCASLFNRHRLYQTYIIDYIDYITYIDISHRCAG